MKTYTTRTPGLLRELFPNWTWRRDRDKKELYLTFDDGPTPGVTEWVLETLDKWNAQATFFCIGKNLAAHPKLAGKLSDSGHTLGNHTFDHLNGWKTLTMEYLDSVARTQALLENLRHRENTTRYFRPPYGKCTLRQSKAIRRNDYEIVMWDVLSGDFDKNIDPVTCSSNVIDHAKGGSIVVFHDSLKAATNLKHALPETLKYFSELGYRFKALT
jgi:peptidoglycan/xylan/chitin deacetylase (PgdA/CDA1 family)